jgi:hypothetical protein
MLRLSAFPAFPAFPALLALPLALSLLGCPSKTTGGAGGGGGVDVDVGDVDQREGARAGAKELAPGLA